MTQSANMKLSAFRDVVVFIEVFAVIPPTSYDILDTSLRFPVYVGFSAGVWWE